MQAYDASGWEKHSWDNEGRGNYWHDWSEPDRDGDGIMDNPYLLEGRTQSKDNYPLAESDVPIPEISTITGSDYCWSNSDAEEKKIKIFIIF